ncbi:MAG: molecular chaperone DjlA, partial [Alphaproteobacteria bacterium HGW-Alphaproteobacteria-12]
MSIWGKIAGAGVGLAVGGPLGALLGAVAGHIVIDRALQDSEVVFTIALIA